MPDVIMPGWMAGLIGFFACAATGYAVSKARTDARQDAQLEALREGAVEMRESVLRLEQKIDKCLTLLAER